MPLFLTPHQTFVEGHDLKAELQKLDAYYSAFPEDVKAKGFYSYATMPPEDTGFLTTQLWDKYLPAWRHKDPDRPDLKDPAIPGRHHGAAEEIQSRFTGRKAA